MTLDPATWLHIAQELPLGGRRRADHDCGNGRTMVVKHGDKGWDAYCWRCSDTGFIPLPRPSMAERLARLTAVRQAEQEAQADTRPPKPMSFDPGDWPLHARVWLYQAGLSNARIKEVGIYYCQRLDRVVLPVILEGRVIYWQARGFDPNRPKYLNPPVDKTAFFAKCGETGPVVLTEDILSAVRVGEAAQGWSIMGTSLSLAQLNQLQGVGPVIVWLDPDAAGRKGKTRVLQALRRAGIPCAAIKTELDPKLYPRDYIREAVLASTRRA